MHFLSIWMPDLCFHLHNHLACDAIHNCIVVESSTTSRKRKKPSGDLDLTGKKLYFWKYFASSELFLHCYLVFWFWFTNSLWKSISNYLYCIILFHVLAILKVFPFSLEYAKTGSNSCSLHTFLKTSDWKIWLFFKLICCTLNSGGGW